MKNYLKWTLIVSLGMMLFPHFSLAMSKSEAVNTYTQELIVSGFSDEELAKKKAEDEANALLELMENAQLDAKIAFDALDMRVKNLSLNDGRRESAIEAVNEAEGQVSQFTAMPPQNHFDVQVSVAGALPRLLPTTDFEIAKTLATEAMAEVNRILINPDRPGVVPEGDIVTDFLPQLIRQLYRFAWVVILISFTVSGIFFVIAKENEERINKAKSMIVYNLIGFVLVALSFALVKALTDIDFFGFI